MARQTRLTCTGEKAAKQPSNVCPAETLVMQVHVPVRIISPSRGLPPWRCNASAKIAVGTTPTIRLTATIPSPVRCCGPARGFDDVIDRPHRAHKATKTLAWAMVVQASRVKCYTMGGRPMVLFEPRLV